MEFINFELHPDLQKGIDEIGYKTCMPVQEQVLSNAFCFQVNPVEQDGPIPQNGPVLQDGTVLQDGPAPQNGPVSQDLYVQSQTGTGKTAAFLIVIYQRMLTEEALFKRKALIMAPTRELAVQIEEEAKALGRYLPFKTGSFYGGVGYTQQEKLLRENVQIMVGTPGRVLDLNKSGRMNLMDIAFLVIDEADRMFDMGFYPDLRKLIRVVPSIDKRQTMLFSATLNSWVKNLAWEYTKSPFEIEIKPEIVTVEEITQILYHVPSEEKMPLLLGILKKEQPESAIIFCNTKKNTEIVAKRLKLNGIESEFIIGDLPQSRRQAVIDGVKAGRIKTLVATDVAARGLDIQNLSMVINYDVPAEAENYVHRIGRTARAGKTGKSVSLASEHDVYELPAIERYIGKKIPSQIANQELYEEDKSAHLHIYTEFYEERHTHGTGAKHEGRKKQGASAEIHKAAKHSRKISPAVETQAEKGGKHRHETGHVNKTDKLHGRKTTAIQHEPDLSHLSMEERMAVYRKKYAGPQAKHGGNKDHSKQQKHHHQVSANEGHENQYDTLHSEEQKQHEPPVNKGFLSRLIELFKKLISG